MDYLKLAEYFEELEKTSKRLEKTFIITKLLKDIIKEKDPELFINLIRGKVFPAWDERKIGVSDKIVIKALETSTGNSKEHINKLFSELGDLGEVAFELVKKKKQVTLQSVRLTVDLVYNNVRDLADLEGEGTVNKKVGLISELLTSATPLEAKFIVRLILEQMRTGAADSTLRDAIVWCFFSDKLRLSYEQSTNEFKLPDNNRKEYDLFVDKVQHGYDLTNDFAEVFKIIKEQGINALEKITLKAGKPINVMLYQKVKSVEEAFEVVGKNLALEYKYDGFRLQIHNNNGNILLYTRRLENVTKQFPDVVDLIKKTVKGENFILDAEIIGIDPVSHKWLSFQNISQRIKRKYDIEKLVKEVPVMVNVFDIISLNNESLISAPFVRRRNMIEKIVPNIPEKIQPAKQLVTDDIEAAKKFYEESLSLGNEGIMAKNLSGEYKPGSRVGYGVKIKPILDTLDLVIVKADHGEGKRAGWLTSFTVACQDSNGNLLEIGKVGSGLKEKEEEGTTFLEVTNLLKPLIISTEGKTVTIKPHVIIEVAFEEIQASNDSSSGFSLRFPRIVNLRSDKKVSDINYLDEIKITYDAQRGRNK